jgi:bacteriocin-like protein
MTNEEKVAKIKELVEEINELSKELPEDELARITGGLAFEYNSTIIY